MGVGFNVSHLPGRPVLAHGASEGWDQREGRCLCQTSSTAVAKTSAVENKTYAFECVLKAFCKQQSLPINLRLGF